MKELPVLSGIQKRPLQVICKLFPLITVKINPCLKKIVAAIGETPMVLVSDSRKKTGKQYGVEGIPHMVIIDRTGKVTAVHIGYGEGQLPRLIKEINEIAQR